MATSTTFPTADDAATRLKDESTEQVRQLADRVASGAHSLADRTVERVGPAIDKIRTTATEATQALQARADSLAEDSRASVRDHPLTWVAAAFAAGVVIGYLGRD